MVREIIRFPHPVLKMPTQKVDVIDKDVQSIVEDMFETMYHAEGVGLAANQIGISLSVMVIDTSKKEGSPPLKAVMINPELLEAEGEVKYKEGCLSFPGLSVEVSRYSKVKVKALDINGEEKLYLLEGFPAIVFQHEMDHLMGITFIDRVNGIKRRLALDKYAKLQKEKV
ncbi:MAG: peptide deformylase [Hydrogenobacter thermophilus]|uniref:peptide deformylase n=1 Tax=Hydrogenobacter thermophilus TaxID=940 RepID=UPI001C76253B|nr:peptide deformylase [Hydrogenobacter thermophilus]QWK19672.1 MAG: peptide deformylase [Hydrogenobacter thermophilus]